MRRRLSGRGRRDRGESLVEMLVAMGIMSVAVVAVVGALVTAVQASTMHRQRVTASAAVRAYAEALQGFVTQTPTKYNESACPVTTYTGFYTPPAGFTAAVTAVKRWDGTQFVTTCPADQGVQLVSLRVTSADGQVSESLDVVVRKPCRTTDAQC